MFEALGKVNRYLKSFFTPSVGCRACSPACDPVAAVLPPVLLAALTQNARSGEGIVRWLSATLRLRRGYLNLKLFNYIPLNNVRYLLAKICTQIFCLVFLKISGSTAVLRPLRTSRLWIRISADRPSS